MPFEVFGACKGDLQNKPRTVLEEKNGIIKKKKDTRTRYSRRKKNKKKTNKTREVVQ